MELIELALDLIATVAGARIAVGIFRYYHKARDPESQNAVVSTAFLVLSLSYLSVGLVTALCAEPLSRLVFGSDANAPLIRLAAGALACTSLTIAPLTFIRVRELSKIFVLANASLLLVKVALNLVFLVGLGLGVKGVFLSNLLGNLLVGGALGTYLVRNVGLRWSRSATRDLLRYGVPLVGTQLATFFATFGDRFFLNAAADEAAVGLYSLAYRFGFLLAAVGYMPFELVWEPERFAVARRADRDEVLARGFVYLNLLMLPAAVGISLFVREVLVLMATPAFHPAAAIVPLIVIAYVFQGWAGIQDIGILIREKTEYVTLANWVAAAVALVGYAIFIPRFLAWGAAGVTVVAFAVRYAGVYWASQRLWPVRYRWGPVLRMAALGAATCAAGFALPPLGLWTTLAAKAALFAVFLLAIWRLGGLEPDERRELAGMAASLRAALRPGGATQGAGA
jgi:O-antigen/teichoic acid export membrane protein